MMNYKNLNVEIKPLQMVEIPTHMSMTMSNLIFPMKNKMFMNINVLCFRGLQNLLY